ncbi:MAG TPA: alpha/beta hydrolase family protein, partial [Polyangia bacterium]|nr:alpha/beta hydrolase family protein [Polyangia bacterium]
SSLLLFALGCASSPSGPGARGRVAEGRFASPALGVEKHYLVYLPAGYDGSTARYPVIYLLHGLHGNEHDWVSGGHLDQAADKLKLQAIVVMPDGDAGFYADSATPADYEACVHGAKVRFFRREESLETYCVRHADYEQYVIKDLLAHVDATYRTVAERRGRAIGGLSMGGFGALSLAMRHPELFASAASHSGVVALLYAGPHPYRKGQARLLEDVSRWGEQVGPIGLLVRRIFGGDLANWRAHDPAALAQTLEPGKLALYVDCGTEDDFALESPAAYLHDVLAARNIPHEFALVPGRHNFALWEKRVVESLAFHARQFRAAGL